MPWRVMAKGEVDSKDGASDERGEGGARRFSGLGAERCIPGRGGVRRGIGGRGSR